jgi:hypothetical protein
MIISMSDDDYDQDDQFYVHSRVNKPGYDYDKYRKTRAQVWERIKSIIEENNENNMDSRGTAYIGMGLKAKRKRRDLVTNIQDPHSDLVYKVEMGRGSGLIGGRGRKRRSDAGKPRKPSDWQLLVKAVAVHEGIPYNKALKVASQYKKEGYTYLDFD